MNKFKEIINIIIKFFPLQLVFLQLKKSHFIVAIWLVFIGFVTQSIGAKFGLPYLFLSPEYLGQVNWVSYMILGFAIGGFYMAYHLYSYIILGPSFPFLVTFSKPFFKFSINNSTFPILFYILLVTNIYDVQHNEELIGLGEIIGEIIALTGGIILFILISVFYFFKTNLDVLKLKGRKKKKKESRGLYSLAKSLFAREKFWFQARPTITYQPSYYFSSLHKITRARPAQHYDRKVIRDIFRQNHLNASVFELALVASFIAMGLLQDFTLVVIPSGASFFLLSTILLMVVTIFYSWFKGWAVSLIVLTLITVNYISDGTGFLRSDNKAYGLSYEQDVPYNLAVLKAQQFDDEAMQNDLVHHIQILEKWKTKASLAQGTDNPKLVILNCSGGGLRAAMWTHYIMQEADERTGGSFFKSTHMITGASGGMIGAAYFRDIYANASFEERLTKKELYLENISKDLLNKVAFNLAAHDIFLRYRKFEEKGEVFLKDRGFSFEEQLNNNTEGVMNKTLGDYVEPEFQSKIPLMIYSPTIINDGRRLIIGAQPYGFLNGNNFVHKNLGPENVEFIKLFKNNRALDVRNTSVLRMNSTFPYILPMVSLPTYPKVHIMDAGIRDNYGTKSTVRYIVSLQDWLRENTSGVVAVEIRDINKDYDLSDDGEFSLFDRVIKPASNFYGNFYQSQEFNSNELIESNLCEDLPIDVLTFVLRKDPLEKIALSWHLTQREKNDIKRTFQNEKNQKELKKLIDLLAP
ncbi:MAG: hypothetical protein P8I55_08705 [Crocinitomix sp.]|nr:hypothetical protein [Crocinitomix sp.]